MALESFLYLRADENVLRAADVAGSIDSGFGYFLEHLTDGRHDTPVRGPGGGGLSLTISPDPAAIDLLVVSHHNLDANVTLGGDLSATIVPEAMPPDGIPYNCFWYGTEVAGVDNITLTISGNDRVPVIGEVLGGVARTMVPFQLPGDLEEAYSNDPAGISWSNLPLDPGFSPPRRWGGSQYYTGAQTRELRDWFLSQRQGSRPSVLIPDETIQDAWLVRFTSFKAERVVPPDQSGSPTLWDDIWLVSLQFEEFPRHRW